MAETAKGVRERSIIQHKRHILRYLLSPPSSWLLNDHHRHEEEGVRIVVTKCKGASKGLVIRGID